MTRRLLTVLGLLAAAAARAHAPSDSYLSVDLAPDPARIQWEIALRDLELVVGLDVDGDGAVTWGELRARRRAIAAHAAAHLHFTAGGAACRVELPELAASRRAERGYAVLGGAVACPGGGAPSRLEYALLLDVDPTHRGLVRIVDGQRAEALVVGEDARHAVLGGGARSPGVTFARFWREGVRHAVAGLDHVLFLVALLLPAAAGRGRQAPPLTRVLLDTATLVTAFTVAHSVTLALAVLGVVGAPPRVVESAIALTVLLAALDNLRPLFGRWRAGVAFGLGLVHGLGFAGALQALGLPPAALGLALAAFNAGVECAQLALVAAVVPLAYALRRWRPWRRLLVPVISVCVALVATLWLVERALDVRVPAV